jgi:HD-like signal output (HDOD) protein
MKRVVFVDDDANVLRGLERMLRSMRSDWDARFADSGATALGFLRERPADALVTDLRMPDMSGTDLLARARDLDPGMARIILSGRSDQDASLVSVGLAHQFLSKPCDADTLKATVSRACDLRALLSDDSVTASVCRIGKLPSLPTLYSRITQELINEDVSIMAVAAIVEQDLAMSAKILQLVNSAFFGLQRRVSSISQAVNLLGLDIIQALVASNAAFEAFNAGDTSPMSDLWRHSSLTANAAAAIARLESDDPIVHGESLQAGMLHDIGQLILAANLPEEYKSLRGRVDSSGLELVSEETGTFGSDHGRVGAYLLGLWGLSDAIVEATAYHHSPGDCSFNGFSPLTAVHVASNLVRSEADGGRGPASLDMEYLESSGYLGRLEPWRTEIRRVVASKEESSG